MCLKQKQIKQLYKFLKINNLDKIFLENFNNDYQQKWRNSRKKPEDLNEYIMLFCQLPKGFNSHTLGLYYNSFFLEAFVWRNTKQGHQFWQDVHYNFIKVLYD